MGHNHAVLMAKDVIKEPFCVINCDDFYNRDTFMVIGKYLSELPEGSKNRYAMVGFRMAIRSARTERYRVASARPTPRATWPPSWSARR